MTLVAAAVPAIFVAALATAPDPLMDQMAVSLDRAMRADHAGQGSQGAKSSLFVRDLFAKPDGDLIFLALTADPCAEIDCRGLPADVVRQAIGIVRQQKQTVLDLEVRRTQAWAAELSAAISVLGFLFSVASFWRSGRRRDDEPPATPRFPI